MDNHIKCTWSTSDVPTLSDFKPGGTGIVNRGSTSKRVKSYGFDRPGRYSWQLLKGAVKNTVIPTLITRHLNNNKSSSANKIERT